MFRGLIASSAMSQVTTHDGRIYVNLDEICTGASLTAYVLETRVVALVKCGTGQEYCREIRMLVAPDREVLKEMLAELREHQNVDMVWRSDEES